MYRRHSNEQSIFTISFLFIFQIEELENELKRLRQQLNRKSSRADTIDIDDEDSDDENENEANGNNNKSIHNTN